MTINILVPLFLAAVVAAAEPASKMPDLLTGNLSVEYLRWTIGGCKGAEPKSYSAEQLARLRHAGVNGFEDYITFCALEPERDRPDWHYYQRNCELIRTAGMRYGVYPWLHFAPKWFVDSPDYVPYVCMEHGQATYSTSIWAPGTLAVYDRFYAQFRHEFGDKVQDIHASMPADYGEVGFPVGMSAWVVPQEHKHTGFWCGDRYARANFREQARKRYHTLDALNRAWGTHFSDWTSLDYPPLHPPENDDGAARRRWLDFIGWYADSQTEFARKAVAVIRKHFPTTPIQIKLGYGGEDVRFGLDNSGVVRMAARNRIIVRSTHGKLPPFFYKRFSTPARFYGAKLLTEPPSGVNRNEEVSRIFNDASNLSTAYFDYPGNILGATDIFERYLSLIQGERALIRVAFFFPTSDHRLRPEQRLPLRLYEQAGALRDITDYDLVDETLVRDGALKDHRLLVMFEGNWLEQETLNAITRWVRAGGTLLLGNFGPIANIGGGTRTYHEWLGPLAARAGDDSLLVAANEAPPRMSLDIGADGDDAFLGEGWWNREGKGSGSRRWTKERATFRVAVNPEKGLTVTVFAEQHARGETQPRLLVNGHDAGELRFTNSSARVSVPVSLLAGHRRTVFIIVSPTWRPSERIPGSKDSRLLGIWVDRIELAQSGVGAADALPPPAVRLDAHRLTRDLTRRVGKGRVVFFPFGREEDAAFRDAVAHLIYSDGAPIQPPVDTEFDGVLAAVLQTKMLFLNETDHTVTKRVRLNPSDFDGVPGPTPPAKVLTLELAPHSITTVRRADGMLLEKNH
ncbi:MAG: beta-galactosidase [Verrucomicrobia bacterium]|nr:beta-galactosidase [Verrucomicrobiota bacterium]